MPSSQPSEPEVYANDLELLALQGIVALLKGCSPEQRERIIKYLSQRFQ